MRRGIALLGLVLAACGSNGETIVGTPGGSGGLRLRYASSPTHVVTTEATSEVTLSIEVLGTDPDGVLVPQRNLALRARRDAGAATIAALTARTDAEGRATFLVRTPPERDRTRITVFVDGDERSFLPYEVVSAPVIPIDMAVGAIHEIGVVADGTILRIPGDPDAEYFFVPYQTDSERVGASYRLFHQGPDASAATSGSGADLAVPRTSAPEGTAPDDVARGSLSPTALEPSADIAASVNIRSCRVDVDRTAPLRYLGSRIALYVDAPASDHQARIDSLGRAFDEAIFPLNTTLFGPTTDLDGNQRVIVVLTPELADVGGVYCDTIRTINVESFYANWNATDPIDRPLSTMAHEHQHVINAGFHLPLGSSGDDRWLNEGLSYAAEALHGYWGGAMVRMWQFLSGQNNGQPMLNLFYRPIYNDRYMMFLLYLRDRFGPHLFQLLETSGRRGVANVETVTGVGFETLLRDWFIATAVSNRGLTDDPIYNYTSVDLHGMSEPAEACRCVPTPGFSGLNMEPVLLTRMFDVTRTLNLADADYYQVRTGAAPDPAYDVFFDPFGRNTTRLLIIRNR